MTQANPLGRIRAYFEFIIAILYFLVAKLLAHQFTRQFASEQWLPLAEQAVLAALLILGYSALGFVLDRQMHPLSEQGWPRRSGWPGEAGLGLATGWTLAVICVLPLTVLGGIAIRLSGSASAWGWLFADAAFFAIAALVEEFAFRGYAFQRFSHALGGLGAALAFSTFYAILQAVQPVARSSASVCVSLVFGLLLSTAYLRTRALWLSWGINFAWKASSALLFGLAVSGDNSHSPVVQGDPMGPFWVTGGGYGIDGTWITFCVLAVAIPVVFRLTRDLDFKYNAPVIVPAGIPVDLDAAARRQHETAMGLAEPAAPPLVQILPLAATTADLLPANLAPANLSPPPRNVDEPQPAQNGEPH
jgi:membrane protease YdiL (CAAX protease family)